MSAESYSRWAMIKNLMVFQIKLAFDAIRDLLLSPVSFVCTVIDIIRQPSIAQSQFAQLMKLGQQTDHWLNLFNHRQDVNDVVEPDTGVKTDGKLKQLEQHLAQQSADQLFEKIEKLLKEQQTSGKLTESAKGKINQYLDKLAQSKGQNSNDTPTGNAKPNS